MEGEHCDILVVGAGPAGCAVAVGLSRLGYRIIVVDARGRHEVCEGVAPRVVDWLRSAGFDRAVGETRMPARRSVTWNGEFSEPNVESLIWRPDFDRALLADLTAAGVEVRRGRLLQVLPDSGLGPCAQLDDGQSLQARLVVDARGRAGNRGDEALRGPPTLSLSQSWMGPECEAASELLSFEDGWAWLARRAEGRYFTQISFAADAPDLPSRSTLDAWLQRRLAELPCVATWVRGCSPTGEPQARASTALLNLPLWRAEGVLRVGDAAMAVDPLSGSGTFQALSSASIAPAVINTILCEPERADLALRFYEDRQRHVFERFARIGRDFYRSEKRWSGHPFWLARSAWPDDEPAHGNRSTNAPVLALRSVVDEGFIREHEVVILDEQPLGVWRVAGVEVAPLLREARAVADAERHSVLEQQIDRASGGDVTRMRALRSWFAAIGK